MADEKLESDRADVTTSEETTSSSAEAYSVFSLGQRCLIVGLLGTATLISPLTATIYLPLLPILQSHFHTSAQAINLTITVYIIFQALAPLFLSNFSDHFGRRPFYLVTFAIYTLASLGLALNRSSYAALLVLRALQSLGGSAVLAVCYGTVADVCVSAQRGKMLSPIMAAGNLGTCIGPIVGGWIALSSGGFWWAFWSLVIFGGVMLFALALLMPETARNVVGNGSVADEKWNQPLVYLLPRTHRRRTMNPAPQDDRCHPHPTAGLPKHRLQFKSPLHSLRLMFYPDTALVLYLAGSFYAMWYTVQASIPSTYKSAPYHFNELQIGLAYLPGATGVIICMYLTGRAMDHNYRVAATRSRTLQNDHNSQIDLTRFPIERARSRGCTWLLISGLTVTVGYGWAIHFARRPHHRAYHVPVAVPLICQFVLGFQATWVINTFNALLVDGFPDTPSAAAAAGNMTRCALSAAAVALMQPLFDRVGRGWFFTMVGVWSGLGGLLAMWALRRWGMGWREKRAEKITTKTRSHGECAGKDKTTTTSRGECANDLRVADDNTSTARGERQMERNHTRGDAEIEAG